MDRRPDQNVIIGSTVDEYTSVEGSQAYPCADCHELVWIAPSGQEMIVKKDLAVLCAKCGKAAIEADADPQFSMPTPQQAAELLQHIYQEEMNRWQGR